MAPISAVFTIGGVAHLLGEDEDWLRDLSINIDPEDGYLWVYGIGEDGLVAFARDGTDICAGLPSCRAGGVARELTQGLR